MKMNLLSRLLFTMLLSLAVKWAERTECRILLDGLPLVDPYLSDAKMVGVKHPDKIRIFKVACLSLPNNSVLRMTARLAGLSPDDTAAIALRYGIFVRAEYASDRNLIAHECVHTSQYERLGGFKAFLSSYLRECLETGYPEAPMEREARLKAAEIHG